MNTIKRFHWTPIWNLEKTERWLHEMELEGYRLEKVSFFRLIYQFKQSKPKTANYFFSYTNIKGKDMSLISQGIKQNGNANEIKLTSVFLSLHRITSPCDLTFEHETRPIYLRELITVYFLLSLFTCLFGILCLSAFDCIGVLIFYSILSGIEVLYYLYGLFDISAQIQRINRKLKK